MNIKSLLLGSAAALAAVSGAQAADAIVAAEPEAMEYVRVCDAFGTGYFYIPGTETCLKISGYVRTQIAYSKDYTAGGADWDPFTRGKLSFSAKTDTEFGTLSSYINIQADTDSSGISFEGAWINVAGFDVGYFYNWWDDYGIAGETKESGGNLLNSVRYTYDAGSYFAGVSVEALSGALVTLGTNDDVGISGTFGGTLGGVSVKMLASYDFDAEESSYEALATADIGPGSLEFMAIYGTGKTVYWSASEWTVAAAYALKASEKLTITPGVQYFGDEGFVDGAEAWKVGLTGKYQITPGLTTLATVNYKDSDAKGEVWSGFVRLQRDF